MEVFQNPEPLLRDRQRAVTGRTGLVLLRYGTGSHSSIAKIPAHLAFRYQLSASLPHIPDLGQVTYHPMAFFPRVGFCQ